MNQILLYGLDRETSYPFRNRWKGVSKGKEYRPFRKKQLFFPAHKWILLSLFAYITSFRKVVKEWKKYAVDIVENAYLCVQRNMREKN